MKTLSHALIMLVLFTCGAQAQKAQTKGTDFEKAYEELVDKLLSSPRYGEHITRLWLDLSQRNTRHHVSQRHHMYPR